MTDISNFKKWLELYRTSSWNYPIPDSSNTVESWGSIIAYDGIIWDLTSKNVKLSETIKDPLSLDNYKYSISWDKKEYEISYKLEDESSLSFISKSFADLGTINHFEWNYNKMFVKSSTWSYVSLPSLIFDWLSWDLTLTLWATSANFLLDSWNTSVSFTPWLIASNRPETQAEIKSMILALKTDYTGLSYTSPNIEKILNLNENSEKDLKDIYNSNVIRAGWDLWDFWKLVKLPIRIWENWVTVICDESTPWETVSFNWKNYWIATDIISDIQTKIFTENFPASDICTSHVTSFDAGRNPMFSIQTSFNQDISSWDVSNVTNMQTMFAWSTAFNQDISNWDVSNVNFMYSMFNWATSFNQDISSWNLWNVMSTSYMFNWATSFNQDISRWDVSNVTNNMSGMFNWATSFNQDISNWNTAKVTSMSSMFQNATNFNQDLSSWNVANVTNHTDFSLNSWWVVEPNWP